MKNHKTVIKSILIDDKIMIYEVSGINNSLYNASC